MRKPMFDDDICALATPMGSGGISVIRVSGKNIFKKVRPFFRAKNLENAKTHKIYYGNFRDLEKNIIDDVLISVFHAPKSYTGENSLEISTHCNRIIIEKILKTLESANIRMAEAGEFTKRAFINGKLDLTQAEAVSDLISANNEYSLKNSRNILHGKLSKIVKNMRSQMLEIAGLLEIDLDFGEDDLDVVDLSLVEKKIDKSIHTIESFVKSSSELRFVNQGIKLAIVGQPNAGKSSLLNAILGHSRAIVSDIEGTTRDSVEEVVNLNGLSVRLIDTAGIRRSSDTIEQMGVERSFSSIDKSDLVLIVIDAKKGFDKKDMQILNHANEKDKKSIIAFNKIDLIGKKQSLIFDEFPKGTISIEISAKNDKNIDILKNEIVKLFHLESLETNDDIVITNLRHEIALNNALNFLKNAKTAINSSFGNEMIAFDIRQAIDELGTVTGEISSNDVLNNIFSNFCIGK
jgi:tRNA modification GTPase